MSSIRRFHSGRVHRGARLEEAATIMHHIGYRAIGYFTKQRLRNFPNAMSVSVNETNSWGAYL